MHRWRPCCSYHSSTSYHAILLHDLGQSGPIIHRLLLCFGLCDCGSKSSLGSLLRLFGRFVQINAEHDRGVAKDGCIGSVSLDPLSLPAPLSSSVNSCGGQRLLWLTSFTWLACPDIVIFLVQYRWLTLCYALSSRSCDGPSLLSSLEQSFVLLVRVRVCQLFHVDFFKPMLWLYLRFHNHILRASYCQSFRRVCSSDKLFILGCLRCLP